MKALIFTVAGQRYGLDASQIVEVVPAVRLRPLPGAPPYVAGVLQYRGELVPVVDMSRLIAGVAARRLFSTRLVLVSHPGPHGVGRLIALLAEGATDGAADDLGPARNSGVSTPGAPFLGPVASNAVATVQFVRVEHVLPEAVRSAFFTEES